MKEFFVSHMTPIKRARMHNGQCSDCNYGAGQAGQHKTNSGNTGWTKALTRSEADLELTEYRKKGWEDVRLCGHCVRKGLLSLLGDTK